MNIELLGNRFIGMFKEQTEGGTALRVEVDFTSNHRDMKWTVFSDPNNESLFMIVPKNERSGNHIYHIVGMEGGITFDDLIRHAKKIIDFNMEVEEKKILLKEKMTELGELFAKHAIEELRDLTFLFPQKTPATMLSAGLIHSRDGEQVSAKAKNTPRKRKNKPVEIPEQEIKDRENEKN
jgi:hypothetical protein